MRRASSVLAKGSWPAAHGNEANARVRAEAFATSSAGTAAIAAARIFKLASSVWFLSFKRAVIAGVEQKNPQAVEGLRSPIFEEKVVDFMLELAKVEEKAVTPEELAKAE